MTGSTPIANLDGLSSSETLVAWRREADYWQKRVERSDDQAAGLLTACLSVGLVAAAAAGYVQARAPDRLDWVKLGIGLLILAGVLTLIGRMWSSPITRFFTGAKAHGEVSESPTFPELLTLERNHAATGKKLAKARETTLAVALLAFAAGVVMIAYAGSEALDAPAPASSDQSSAALIAGG